MNVVDIDLEMYCVGYAVIDQKYCHNAKHFIDVNILSRYNIRHSLHILVLLIPFEPYILGNKQTIFLKSPRNVRQSHVTRSDVGRSLF